jgi:hypothetical protein
VFLLVFLLAFFWSRFWCSSGSGCSSGVLLAGVSWRSSGVVVLCYHYPEEHQKKGGLVFFPFWLLGSSGSCSFWCSFWRSSGPDSGVLLVLVALLVLVLCYRATEKNPEARRTPEGTSEETAPPCPLLPLGKPK